MVFHGRLEPKKYHFLHRLFMFYLDLDEMESLGEKFRWMSRNRFNLYNFRDGDHLSLGAKTVKENLLKFALSKGADLRGARIMLLTHLRTLGHIFNPVSFYFCFDPTGTPICVIPEVGNTFGEMKPYFLGKENLKDGEFKAQIVKYFYISPFIDLDATLDFCLRVPDGRLDLRVDDIKNGRKFFMSGITGERKKLEDKTLLGYFFRFPLITLRVIGLIHWHAFILHLKGLPYQRIEDHRELQREVVRERKR